MVATSVAANPSSNTGQRLLRQHLLDRRLNTSSTSSTSGILANKDNIDRVRRGNNRNSDVTSTTTTAAATTATTAATAQSLKSPTTTVSTTSRTTTTTTTTLKQKTESSKPQWLDPNPFQELPPTERKAPAVLVAAIAARRGDDEEDSSQQLFMPLGGHSFRWRNSSYIFPDGTRSIIKTTSLYEGAFYAYLFAPVKTIGMLNSTQLANLTFFAHDPRDEGIITATAEITNTNSHKPPVSPMAKGEGRNELFNNQLKSRLNLTEIITPLKTGGGRYSSDSDLEQLRRFLPRVHAITVCPNDGSNDEDYYYYYHQPLMQQQQQRQSLVNGGPVLGFVVPICIPAAHDDNEKDDDENSGGSYDAFMRNTCYIEMENLVGIDPAIPQHLRPTYCAMDLKIGTRFWGLDAGKEKRARMNRKAEITTAAKTGLCLIAYKCIDPVTQEIACQMTRQRTRQISTAEELYSGLQGFFSLTPAPVLTLIKQEVELLLDLFRRQEIAHFYSSSLLVIYDSRGLWPMKLKLIDFEHASLYHFKKDESFLTGLTNFSNFLNTLVDDCTSSHSTAPDFDNVKNLLPLTYKTINGRNINSIQPAELQALFLPSVEHSAPDYFIVHQLATIIQSEINFLLEDHKPHKNHNTTKATLVPYHPNDDECNMSSLYDLLSDLLLVRLKTNKIQIEHLTIRLSQENEKVPSTFVTRQLLQHLTKIVPITNPSEVNSFDFIDKIQTIWENRRSEGLNERKPLFSFKDQAKDVKRLDELCRIIDEEYRERTKVLITRLGVTAQAFFQTSGAAQNRMIAIYRRTLSRLNALDSTPYVSLYSILAANESLLTAQGAYKKCSIASPIKKINIGEIRDRGGIPEGFTREAVRNDVTRANTALKGKLCTASNNSRGTDARGVAVQPPPQVRRKVWQHQGWSNTVDNTPSGRYRPQYPCGGSYREGNCQPFPGSLLAAAQERCSTPPSLDESKAALRRCPQQGHRT